MTLNGKKGEGIDKQSPIPIYFQIMNDLREQIANGDYPVDSLLPSERELVEIYQVSRMTIRQAILELVSEGILVRRKGVGTFVSRPKIRQSLNSMTSFTEDMALRGLKAGTRFITFRETLPNPVIRKTLELGPDETIFEFVRVRLADDEPMSLETTALVAAICPGLKREDLENHSLYALLTARWGVQPDYAVQSLECAIALPHEAPYLHVATGAPLLLMYRTAYDHNGRPFEFVKSLYRCDRYKFAVTSKLT